MEEKDQPNQTWGVNSHHFLHADYMPGTCQLELREKLFEVQNAQIEMISYDILHSSSPLTPPPTELWGYYPHFIEKKTEAQGGSDLAQVSTAGSSETRIPTRVIWLESPCGTSAPDYPVWEAAS